MGTYGTLSGINLKSLKEAFSGSEEVLGQMLTLFEGQARERLAQLESSLGAWDTAAARGVLHSLVNICGAVRAYSMSEQAKAVGEAIKRDDRAGALRCAEALQREGVYVLTQVGLLLEAAKSAPQNIWDARWPDQG
jgi:HPt (histidine-containing phosphotransfer) domain-containing protein